MKSNPPRWADQFLEWFCNPQLLEDLQGDLYEVYHARCNDSPRMAQWVFIWLVFRSFRYSVIKKPHFSQHNFFTMTSSNFKIATRVLLRQRFTSSVNLLGLTIGIACFVLLGLYVKQELSFDHFNTQKDRIYRTWLKEDHGEGKLFFSSTTPFRFENFLESSFPEIVAAVQYNEILSFVGRGEKRINESVAIISPEFFQVFNFQLLYGNTSAPLASNDAIVISESYAIKYFGEKDAIGGVLSLQLGEEIRDFVVSAVFKDSPYTSSIRFNMAFSNGNNARLFNERVLNAWFQIQPETYVLLKENTKISSIEEKIQAVVRPHLPESERNIGYLIGFQPLTDIHLNPSIPLGYAPVSNPQYVFILGAIGILILVIASVNYTTLSIGQSLTRSHEVGVRKVLGSKQSTLVAQFLSESMVMSIAALSIGVLAAILSIPMFNKLTNTNIQYSFSLWHLPIFLCLGILVGFISGIYPALVISRFKVITIFKGNAVLSGKQLMQKGMVAFQFLVTIFMIASTFVMQSQLKYLQNKDLGHDQKAIIEVKLHATPTARGLRESIASGQEHAILLKTRLENYPEISDIAMGSHIFGTDGWAKLSFSDDQNVFRNFRMLIVDAHYLNAFGIRMKEGRGFEEGNGLDQRQSVILNQEAVDYFGLENPIGSKLPNSRFGEHHIIGVTDNFHFSSLHNQVEPLVIVQNPLPMLEGASDVNFDDSLLPKLVFTYNGTQMTKAIAILQKEWEELFPNQTWNFAFVEERVQRQYESEKRLGKLVSIAAVLSIIIAVLGLMGVTMLIINNKLKEISIRRVMGASTLNIFSMLGKSFSVSLAVATVLAVLLTVWAMKKWLENFVFRTEIGVGQFAASILISLIVYGAIIGLFAMATTKRNPIDSLKIE